MADIAFVAEAHAALTTAGTSITCAVPSGTQDGDVMLAIILADNIAQHGAIVPPGGGLWTLVDSVDIANPHFHQCHIYTRVASGEPANYSWTVSSNGALVASITTWRGVDTTAPVEATQLTQDAALNTTFQCDGVTTLTAGAVAVYAYGINEGSTPGQRIPITPHASTTKRSEAATSGIVIGNGLSVCSEARPTAGATGARNATSANLNGRNIAYGIALKRAPIIANITGSLGTLSGSITGSSVVAATVGGSLGSLSGSVTGSPVVAAVVSGSLGALTGSISAAPIVAAALSGSLGSLSGTITATPTVATSVAGSLGALSGTVSASPVFGVSVAGSLGSLSGGVTAAPIVTATISGALGDLSGSVVIGAGVSGHITGSLGALSGAIVATPIVAVTLSGSLGALAGLIGEADANRHLAVESQALVPALASIERLRVALAADNNLDVALVRLDKLTAALAATETLTPALTGFQTLEPRPWA